MAFAAAVIIVPLSLIFFISGFVINILQAVSFVLIWPLSKNTYRKINRMVFELLLLEIIWLVDWWAGVKIKMFVDHESFDLMGKEHALLVSNHKSDIDWLVGWILAQRSGCLGSSLAVMKNSIKFLPVIGWSMWFSEYLFLDRKWSRDENTLKTGLKRLENFPRPFWLALFVEGTRFTQAKLRAAQEYATSQGLHVPRNVLVPRTKGFVTAVSHLRSFVPAIYDITVAIPEMSPSPTLLRLFNGQSSVVHIHMRRRLMEQLPETDEAIARWCKDMFVEKDKLVDKHITENTFSDQPSQDIGRPIKSLLVMVSWACIVAYGTLKFLQWSSLLSSWKGIAFFAFGLVIVTILMHILILFSQSERSNPVEVASRTLPENDHQSSDSIQKPLLV